MKERFQKKERKPNEKEKRNGYNVENKLKNRSKEYFV